MTFPRGYRPPTPNSSTNPYKNNNNNNLPLFHQFNKKGLECHVLGKYNEAVCFFQKSLEINPNDSNVWYNLGKSLEKFGHYDNAIKFIQSLQINSKNDQVLNQIGIIYFNSGKFKESIRYFEKALEINPKNITFLQNKNTAYSMSGNNIFSTIGKVINDIDYSNNYNYNNDSNKINKNENYSWDRPIPTTIGEAVKEVIETGKEVVIEGSLTAGELTGVKEGDLESPNETRFLSKEEKIIVNPKESKTDREDTITTVTTIPTEGVNVEAQTEFTVPLKDKEENIEVETDVKVNPTRTTSSVSRLESSKIEKSNLSSTDELNREKNPPQSEFDKETINPKILLEKEEQQRRRQEESLTNVEPLSSKGTMPKGWKIPSNYYTPSKDAVSLNTKRLALNEDEYSKEKYHNKETRPSNEADEQERRRQEAIKDVEGQGWRRQANDEREWRRQESLTNFDANETPPSRENNKVPQSMPDDIERYPYARFPDKVLIDDIIPLEVIIKSTRPSSITKNFTSINLKVDDKNQKEIPIKVFVKCNYDEFEIVGNYFAIINVPVEIKDSEPVTFNIKPKKEGEHLIQILFLQETTVVGEINIKTLVTRTKNPTIDYKKEWKSDYQTLENPISGPDITTIYIYEINSLQYDVVLIDSDVPYKMDDAIKFPFNPETKFYKIFEEIEKYNASSMTKVNEEIKDIGMSLYDELFPKKLKELYWELRDRIKSVRVISNEPWIPWEIIKPWRQLENGVGEEDDFLCERYTFSRWIEKPDRNKKEVKNIKVIIPNDTNLAATRLEQDWILGFSDKRNIKISFDSSYDQVINTLKTEKEIDILHFSTHGQKNKEDYLLSVIELEGNTHLKPRNLEGKKVTFGQSHPMVVINACQTGNQGFSLTGIQGWATRFLEAGASVFIGTLWSVNDETAFNFVKEFYNQLASGVTLGESVKNARNKCKEDDNTSWLAYQLYGHPNCTIKF
jgi:tetratricopeptide (TPR) repeat protein